ncbi:DUF916 and DUF3324 domain-containing protein [Companilactobacillus jidongensis]|uniref:DUF916 and DUF3324 domain-containing protein n=1 Tax=Companilactobacillus jidongensis TaxID=2486006 RepID=UPI0013DE4E24|nr:DUF916 and DUF3324 domain-containing protein [Companilactobacillus jidongensis]
MTKKIFLPIILAFASLFVFLVTGVTSVKADTLNYTVGADLPDNQIEKSGSYFDLKVTPGQSQNLTIKINNKDSVSHHYEVSVNRGLTNSNGVIDYSTHGSSVNDNLAYNIESLVTSPQDVEVDANTTKLVTVHLDSPKENFSGIILGGIRVQEITATPKAAKKGIHINNEYAYVIGLELRQNSDKIKPKLNLGDINEKQVNYYNYVAANLINPTPSIIDNLSVNATVKNSSGKEVYKQNKTGLSMAPNSNFDYLIGSPKQTLKAGTYELILDAKAGTSAWHFDRKFTVTTQTVKKLAKTSIVKNASPEPNYLLIAFIIAIVLVMILVTLAYRNKYIKKH